jgi:hypothetical protein
MAKFYCMHARQHDRAHGIEELLAEDLHTAASTVMSWPKDVKNNPPYFHTSPWNDPVPGECELYVVSFST